MDIPEKPKTLLAEFDNWLYHQRPEGASVYEGTQLIMGIMLRMRQALTFKEMHYALHKMIVYIEERLQDNAEWERPDGSRVPVVLAEQWRFIEGGADMLKDITKGAPDTIPEEWNV